MGDTNSTKPQQEQPDDPFTCEICIEPMLSNNKKFRNNNLCVHPFCNECITKYVQSKNEEEWVAGIKCPGSNCDKLLEPLTCRALVPPEVSDRCYCPNRVCSAVVVKECGGIVKKSMCPNCKHCVEHVHSCSIIKCRCGRSFSCECGRKVHQPQCCYCKDKATNEDTTKKEKHMADINKKQVVPHQCYCKDKANNEDTTKKKNPSLCPLISFCIVFVVLFYLFAAFINRKH